MNDFELEQVRRFLEKQESLPHNHEPGECPTWCCVRRAAEELALVEGWES